MRASMLKLSAAVCAYCDVAIEATDTAVVSPDDEKAVMHARCAAELASFAPGPVLLGVGEEEALRREHATRPEVVAARIDARGGRH